MPLFAEGQVIRDTYTVERRLGEGAFGEVYRVHHRFLGRQALKVFKTVGMTVKQMEEALGEALILARLGHPNITRVFEANTFDTPGGKCGFFTMEYVTGGSLEDYWRSQGSHAMPVGEAVDFVRQVCSGLAIAHLSTPPIVHRDIKPSNILLNSQATGLKAQLSDFGLAKHVNPMTLMASSKGTIGFKAPESFKTLGGDSCTSDVWAVGCTLYLLLTDQMPYPQADEADLLKPPRYQSMTPPSRLNVHVDRRLDEILERALALNPRDRYTNAQVFLTALERWAGIPPAPVVPALTPLNKRPMPTKTVVTPPSDVTPLPVPQPVDLPFSQPVASPPPPVATPSVHDEARALSLAREAVQLARQGGRLAEAARTLEEACNLWPPLREDYEDSIRLWRMGIVM